MLIGLVLIAIVSSVAAFAMAVSMAVPFWAAVLISPFVGSITLLLFAVVWSHSDRRAGGHGGASFLDVQGQLPAQRH